MTETIQQQTEAQDSSLEAINALSVLDLRGLSYVQLKRLEKTLLRACAAVAAESQGRADVDNSGDTVNIPTAKT